jgi:hypothetical protein
MPRQQLVWRIQTTGHRFSRSTSYPYLLFAAATLISIIFMGYHFGTFDQAIHIPFLKKYADPSLYPNDPFFDMRLMHYSYFWFFFQPFYRLGILEMSMFVVYGGTIYFTFWTLWRLSMTLFDNTLAALLSIVGFTLPHIGFAGFSTIEFSLLNRTFVLPFLLLALDLYLRRRYLWAFLLLGLMYNLHVISVNFALGMVLFDCALQFRRVGWRNIVFGMAGFVVAALPVLIWKMDGSPVDFSVQPEWFDIITRGMLYSLFYLIAPYPQVLLVTLCGISTIALFFLARRQAPSPRHDQSATNFVYAAILILVVEIITAHWYPATIIVQSQIMRAGLFIIIFSYLYFANYIAQRFQSGELKGFDFALLVTAMILSIVPFILLIVWFMERFIASARWRRLAAAIAVPAMFAGTMLGVYQARLWGPGIHIFAQRSPWYDTQAWARDHTPKEAVFITPPQLWWFYDLEWRVVSERSTVVTLSELLEAAFSPEYIARWKPRFEALAPGALAQFRGDVFTNTQITARAFYSLSSDDLQRRAREYGASYLVVEKPHHYDFPAVYENEGFVVYDLTHH